MNKLIKTDCLVIDIGKQYFDKHSCTIEVTDDYVEFRAHGEYDIIIRCALDTVKKILGKATVSGGTYIEADKANRTIVRYTKGFGGFNHRMDGLVTMSLSTTDNSGKELCMISAEATKLDKLLRKQWEL